MKLRVYLAVMIPRCLLFQRTMSSPDGLQDPMRSGPRSMRSSIRRISYFISEQDRPWWPCVSPTISQPWPNYPYIPLTEAPIPWNLVQGWSSWHIHTVPQALPALRFPGMRRQALPQSCGPSSWNWGCPTLNSWCKEEKVISVTPPCGPVPRGYSASLSKVRSPRYLSSVNFQAVPKMARFRDFCEIWLEPNFGPSELW